MVFGMLSGSKLICWLAVILSFSTSIK
jgi:hypothetical protein